MATKQLKTIPPKTELWGIKQSITLNNLGGHYNYWPYFLEGMTGYGSTGAVDYRSNYPLGDVARAGLDQWKSCKYIRTFRPGTVNFWDVSSFLSNDVVDIMLNILDFWHQKVNNEGNTLQLIWVIPGYSVGGSTWGYLHTSVDYEIQYQAFLTALLTSTRTNPSGLGYTFANHPALAAVEFSNEQIKSGTDYAAYARIARITNKLFAQYKPACKVLNLCATGGNHEYMYSALNGSAISIQTPVSNGAVGSPSDDGTGKVGSDYLIPVSGATGYLSHHFYGNAESFTTYNAQIADNSLSSRHLNHNWRYVGIVFENLCRYKASQPLLGKAFRDIPLWNTECGILEMFTASYLTTGSGTAFRWHRISRQKRFEALLRWFLPTLFMTSDGAGGIGVSVNYSFDIISDSRGCNGTVSNIRNSAGAILIDVNDAPYNFASLHCYPVTCTSASPAVLTWTGKTPVDGEQFDFSAGTAPTGTSLGTKYYVKNAAGSKCQFSDTVGGASINTTSTGASLRAAPSRFFEYPDIYVTAGASGWADVGLAAGQSKWLQCKNPTTFINGIATLEVDGFSFTAAPADNPTFSHPPLRLGPYPDEWHEFANFIRAGLVTFGWIHYSTTNIGIYVHVEGVGNYYTKSDGTLSTW